MASVRHRVFTLLSRALLGVLASSCLGITKQVSAETPARATSAASGVVVDVVDATSIASSLQSALIQRAKRAEREPKNAGWDEAVDIASTLRARLELLHAGVLSASEAALVRQQAARAAKLVASFEVAAWRGQGFCADGCSGARGWGTSKPIEL